MKPKTSARWLSSFATQYLFLVFAALVPFALASAQDTVTNPPSNTEATPGVSIGVGDDTIPLIGTHKWTRSTTGSVFLTTTSDSDVTVVLVNPPVSATNSAHRLSFGVISPGETLNPDGTLTVVLPRDGTSKRFSISGSYGSSNTGDAIIEAHQGTNVLNSVGISVYWLRSPHMFLNDGGAIYASTVDRSTGKQVLYTTGNVAARLISEISLEPPGVSVGSTPSLDVIKSGILQNVLAHSAYTAVYDKPYWKNPIERDTVTVSSQYKFSSGFSSNTDDVLVSSGYNGPEYISPVPMSQGLSSVSDTPRFPAALTRDVDATTAGGQPATVRYTRLISINIDADFSDWCSLHNFNVDQSHLGDAIQLFKQSSWHLHVGTGKTMTHITFVPTEVDQAVTNSSGVALTNDPSQVANNSAVETRTAMGPSVTLNGTEVP